MKTHARWTHDPNQFWRHVDKGGPGGCWLWTRCRNERGYGMFSHNGKKNIRAHRFAWELRYGPTPSDKFCLHKCDVRHCVNPDHLYLGSAADNTRDMEMRDRQRYRGERNYQATLTDAQVLEIRRAYKRISERRSNCRELAKRFGVKLGAVRDAAAGRTYRHLPMSGVRAT